MEYDNDFFDLFLSEDDKNEFVKDKNTTIKENDSSSKKISFSLSIPKTADAWIAKAKDIIGKTGETLSSGATAGIKEIQTRMLKIDEEKIKAEEDRLINDQADAIDRTVKLGIGYAACALFMGPILAIIPAMIGNLIANKTSGSNDRYARKKIYERMSADIKMLDEKIKDLQEEQSLNDSQKAQKYHLIQVREKLRINVAKLRAALKYGTTENEVDNYIKDESANMIQYNKKFTEPNNSEELKSRALRLARRINKEFKKSDASTNFKNFFNESSIRYFDSNGIKGVMLNTDTIDCDSYINDNSINNFKSNIKLLEDTVNKLIKKENLENYIQLVEMCPNQNEKFNYESQDANKYLNLSLAFNEAGLSKDFQNYQNKLIGNSNRDYFDDLHQKKYFGEDQYTSKTGLKSINSYDIIDSKTHETYGQELTAELQSEINSKISSDSKLISDIGSKLSIDNKYNISSDLNGELLNTSLTNDNSYTNTQHPVFNKIPDVTVSGRLSESVSYINEKNTMGLFGPAVMQITVDRFKEITKFMVKLADDYFDFTAEKKNDFFRENDILYETWFQKFTKDINNLVKGRKVTLDYFLFYKVDSYDRAILENCYKQTSEFLKAKNAESRRLKTGIVTRIEYVKDSSEVEREYGTTNTNCLRPKKAAMLGVKYSPQSKLAQPLLQSINQYNETKHTTKTTVKYTDESYSLYVFTQSPAYELNIDYKLKQELVEWINKNLKVVVQ